MTKLLLDTPPLVLQKELAVLLGSVDKALALQQVHYLIGVAEEMDNRYKFRNGKWWVYNSYEEWHSSYFPTWSVTRIGRIFRSLAEIGVIESAQLMAGAWDRRKWYTIDYERLDALICTFERAKSEHSNAPGVNDQSCHLGTIKSENSSNNSPEKSSERNAREVSSPDEAETEAGAESQGEVGDPPPRALSPAGIFGDDEHNPPTGAPRQLTHPSNVQVAEHLAAGLGQPLPTNGGLRTAFLTAARDLLDATDGSDPAGVCTVIDRWFASDDPWAAKVGSPRGTIQPIARLYHNPQAGQHQRSDNKGHREPPASADQSAWDTYYNGGQYGHLIQR